jgi:antitoxin component YwqK of YwqJK toxin-antitoxin module
MKSCKNLTLLLILIAFAFCNGGGSSEKTKEDSLKTVEKFNQVQEEKKKNIYLIEPPDTNYTGDYVDKYDNGNTKFKGFFRFGKRHGQWLAFYAHGTLWSECFYDNGLRHGANNVYFENQQPNYKGWFKHDLRDSVWIFYNENGVELKRVKFKNDEEVPL